MLAEYSVAWLTAESGNGWTCGMRWIDDPREMVSVAGWASLAAHVAGTADADLDLGGIDALLDRVKATLHQERNRVRYSMNGFVIAVGKVSVHMGTTACKVPFAPEYIDKSRARGPVKKRKTFRC